MRIGLLVSELQDEAVRKICYGADFAAKKYDISLSILPGSYLPGNMKTKSEQKYDYQNQALFNYISEKEFDLLIVDIEKIGKNTTILKKDELLKSFGEIPLLTMSEEEGFTNVNLYENITHEQQGFLAVHDAIYYVNNKELPEQIELKDIKIPEIALDKNAVAKAVSFDTKLLHSEHRDDNTYRKIAEYAIESGIINLGVCLFDEPIINTIKEKWTLPESIKEKVSVLKGQSDSEGENDIDPNSIFKNCESKNNKTTISKVIYVEDKQYGIITCDYNPLYASIFYEIITNMIFSAIRINDLTDKNELLQRDLDESREELARDGSVLDHIGDTDYLTGLLNRRGFFDKAYEAMKNKYVPGTYVVVAYIDMASIKNINEMFGHEEGDRAVKRVAAILTEVFGDVSIYGRIRGDEFAVLHVTEDESKVEKFKLLMSEQNARLMTESGRYLNHLQFSICEFSYEDNMSLREMLKETDNNLKKMKKIQINK